MDVHPAELALEPLPAVPLHNLAADVAWGDVLEGVLGKLVVGLKDRGRLHLDIKNIQFQNQNDLGPTRPFRASVEYKNKNQQKKDKCLNSDTRRNSFLDNYWHGLTPPLQWPSYHSPPSEPSPRPGSAPGCCSAGCPSHSWKRSPTCFWFVRSLWHWNR